MGRAVLYASLAALAFNIILEGLGIAALAADALDAQLFSYLGSPAAEAYQRSVVATEMVVSVLTNGLALAIAMPGVGGGGAQAAAAALWGSAAHHACGAVVHGSQPHRPMAAGVYQLHALLAAVDLALAVACFIAPGTRRPPQDDKTEHGHNPNRPSMLSLAALLGNVLLLLPVHAVILDVQLGSTGGWAAFAGFPYTPELLAPSLAGDAAQRGVDVGFAMSNAASAASAVAFACFAGLVSATRGGAGRDVSGALLGALALHAGLVVSFVAFGSSAGVAVADAWAAAKIHASIGVVTLGGYLSSREQPSSYGEVGAPAAAHGHAHHHAH